MLKSVLCIDDDPIAHFYTKAVLKQSGLIDHIVCVSDGQEALEYFEGICKQNDPLIKSFPDLILLDLNMPVMDGWTFLDHYTNKYHPILNKKNIVVVSSSISQHDIARSETYSSVLYFISKPLSVKMIKNINDWIYN